MFQSNMISICDENCMLVYLDLILIICDFIIIFIFIHIEIRKPKEKEIIEVETTDKTS